MQWLDSLDQAARIKKVQQIGDRALKVVLQRVAPLGLDGNCPVDQFFSSFEAEEGGTKLSQTAVARLVTIGRKIDSQEGCELEDFRSKYDPNRNGSIKGFWNISESAGNGHHSLIRCLVDSLNTRDRSHALIRHLMDSLNLARFRYEVSDRILKCVLSEQIDIEESNMRNQGLPLSHGQKYRTIARDSIWPDRKKELKRFDNAGQRWRQFKSGCLIGFGACSINNLSVYSCIWLDTD